MTLTAIAAAQSVTRLRIFYRTDLRVTETTDRPSAADLVADTPAMPLP